jgi:hypothetical protein
MLEGARLCRKRPSNRNLERIQPHTSRRENAVTVVLSESRFGCASHHEVSFAAFEWLPPSSISVLLAVPSCLVPVCGWATVTWSSSGSLQRTRAASEGERAHACPCKRPRRHHRVQCACLRSCVLTRCLSLRPAAHLPPPSVDHRHAAIERRVWTPHSHLHTRTPWPTQRNSAGRRS